MITTIQIDDKVKDELKRMKAKPNETYEDVILRSIKRDRAGRIGDLKEGYLECVDSDKEWASIDKDWD